MPPFQKYTISRAYLLLILLLVGIKLFANDHHKSIEEQYKEDKAIEELLDLMNEDPDNSLYSLELSEKLAKYYYRNNQYKNALNSYLSALKTAKELKNDEKIIKHRYNIGLLYTKLGNFPLAIDYLSRIFLEDDCDKSSLTEAFKSDIYGELATAYLYIGNYAESSRYQIKALRIREELQDTLGVGKSQYTFGNMYFQQQNYKEAKKYYDEALATWKSNNFEGGIYRCYSALGSVHSKLGEDDKSLKYNLIALELTEKLEIPTGIAYALNNVGENYQASGAFGKASDYFHRSLEMMLELEDKNGQIILLEAIGNLLLQQGEAKESLEKLEEALQLAEEIGASPRRQALYFSLAENYSSTGDLKEAFAYKEKYIQLKNSLLDESDLELINQMQITYDLEKNRKELAISKLQQHSELQNIYWMLGVAIIAFLLFSISIGYIRFQIRLKERDLLQVQQANINSEKEEIKDSNEDLERFVYVVAHDLREPLRMIGSYTKILGSHLRKFSSTDTKKQIKDIQQEAGKMTQLLDNLLEYSRLDRHQEILTPVDVNEIVNIAKRKQIRSIIAQSVTITTDNLPIVAAFPKQLTKLYELLLVNAIKFRQEGVNPLIHISYEEHEGNYVFKVQDNGIGIEAEKQAVIFNLFKRGHDLPSYDGTGFGLAYCKKVVENHQGKIWVESEPQKGSAFFISLSKGQTGESSPTNSSPKMSAPDMSAQKKEDRSPTAAPNTEIRKNASS